MISLSELQEKLETEDFYKKAIPNFMLFIKRWKKDFQKYQEADESGIAENILLREEKHEETLYRVFAYSVNGEISEDKLEEIKCVVNEVPLGQIRYESNGSEGFFPITGDEDYKIKLLYKHYKDIYFQVVADAYGKSEKLDCPYSIYIKKGSERYHWTVARKYLQ